MYCSLILPYINYGILIWGSASKMYLDKILKLQKWAMRTISHSNYRSHTGPLFLDYEILNVYDTYLLNLGIFMFKHHADDLPAIFKQYFIKHAENHKYATRNAQDYAINKTKKTFSNQAIRNCGPSFWNSLEKSLKQCKTLSIFKTKLKSNFLSSY